MNKSDEVPIAVAVRRTGKSARQLKYMASQDKIRHVPGHKNSPYMFHEDDVAFLEKQNQKKWKGNPVVA